MKTKSILYILPIFVVAACSKSAGTNVQNVSTSFGEGSVKEITLEDGTHCAVLIGYYKGGITCNWKQ